MTIYLTSEKKSMTFDNYQREAFQTAEYPDKFINMLYPAMGLAGEAGELLDKIKKHWRNKWTEVPKSYPYSIDLTDEERLEAAKELGDVLWYINAMSIELGYDLREIAAINIEKLKSRRSRGTIKSAGDNR